jgi:hypothetical protein
VGPTGGRQPGLCLNHWSYHSRTSTHFPIIYK